MLLKVKRFGNSGPPLIILHGLLGSSQNWHSAAKELSNKFRVIVPDLRNHGDSPHGKHSITAMSRDIEQLFESETIDTAFLLGHSMGGLAAMRFAFDHPEKLKALIIEDITPVVQTDGMEMILSAMQDIDLGQVERREDADEQLAQRIENKMVRQFLLQNLKRQQDETYVWRCNLDELYRYIRQEHRFELSKEDSFEGRTLFIGGGKSEHRIWEQEKVIAEHFPNYEMKIIDEAGHWVHFEAMDEFIATLVNFIGS